MRRAAVTLLLVLGLVGVAVDPAHAATGRVTTPFTTGFEGATIPLAFDWSGSRAATRRR